MRAEVLELTAKFPICRALVTEEQALCSSGGGEPHLAAPDRGLSRDFDSGPACNGVRYPPEGDATGWYL